MTQAQKWLDENYPYDQRTNITKIKTGEKDLEGPLKIEWFANLEEICCPYNQLSSLEITNCPNLKLLSCENNQITDLKIDSCHELTGLYCCHNKLTNLDLSENKKINILVIDDNNFSEQDLSFLSHLINLESLQLGNIMSWVNEEKNDPDIYNQFSGSLEHLRDMTKLCSLDICNTDIESGLEYLPLSLEEFLCLSSEREGAKSNLIANELRKFGEPVGEVENCINLLEEWRKDNVPHYSQLKQEITKLEEELRIEREEIQSYNKTQLSWYKKMFPVEFAELEKTNKEKNVELADFINYQDKKIKDLEEQVGKQQAQIETPPK